MVNGDEIINELFVLFGQYIDIDQFKVFKYEKKPNDNAQEYIVINHLPLENVEGVCEVFVNINIHQKDSVLGLNIANALTITQNIRDYFGDETKALNGKYYEISDVSQPMKDNDNTHFINVRLRCLYTNHL